MKERYLIGNNNEKKYEVGSFSSELNERASKIKVRKEETNLENRLNYDDTKPPQLNLTKYHTNFVAVKNKEEYDLLMKFYDSASWKWIGGFNPIDVKWVQTKECYFAIDDNFSFRDIEDINPFEDTLNSIDQFYDLQEITPETIREINNWYDKNRPERTSKK